VHIADRAYDTGHGGSKAISNGSERGSGFMLGSQRSHCHDKTDSGVVDSSKGIGRTSTSDRYQAETLDGHRDRQIRR